MTKARDPLTVADAVTDIAKELGWDKAAALFGCTVRLVAAWSDPDDPREPSLRQALALDAAYRAKTGQDFAPIQAAYAHQLDQLQEPVGNAEALRHHIGAVAKESGEVIGALVAASEPNADPSVHKAAARELDELAEEVARARACLAPKLRVVG